MERSAREAMLVELDGWAGVEKLTIGRLLASKIVGRMLENHFPAGSETAEAYPCDPHYGAGPRSRVGRRVVRRAPPTCDSEVSAASFDSDFMLAR